MAIKILCTPAKGIAYNTGVVKMRDKYIYRPPSYVDLIRLISPGEYFLGLQTNNLRDI